MDDSMLPLFGLLLTVLVTIFLYYHHRYQFWKRRGIPGPRPLPIFGNLSIYFHRPYFDAFVQMEKKHGKGYGIYNGLTPKLVVTDLDLLKDIMIKNFSNFTDRRTDGFDHPLEREFMLVMEGKDWKRLRNIMSPAFSSSKLKRMVELFESCSNKVLEHIDKAKGNSIEVKRLFKQFTVDVIGKTAFGVDFGDVYNNMDSRLENSLYFFQPSTIRTVLSYILPSWIKSLTSFSVFNRSALQDFASIARAMVNERRKETPGHHDFLSLLLDGDVSESEIISNIILLFWVAFETAAYHLSYTMWCLARYPDVQEKLFQEIMDACGGDVTKINCDLVSSLPYFDAVSNESLRLYPPSTFTERKVSKDCVLRYKEPDGMVKNIHLPRGTLIFIPIYAIHHSEEYWKDPEEFIPERFLGELEDRHPFSFLPFGHGPRNCIGSRYETLESKVIMAKLVSRYQISLMDGDGDRSLDLSSTNDELLMTPDIWLKFERRTS